MDQNNPLSFNNTLKIFYKIQTNPSINYEIHPLFYF